MGQNEQLKEYASMQVSNETRFNQLVNQVIGQDCDKEQLYLIFWQLFKDLPIEMICDKDGNVVGTPQEVFEDLYAQKVK